MKDIWPQDEEARRLHARFDALKKEGVGQAEFARQHQIPGGASMVSQHIKNRRPMNLESATAYAKGFGCSLEEISPRLAKEVHEAAQIQHGAALVAPSPPQKPLSKWPFSAITEAEFDALPEAARNRLDGALALAIAQMRLGGQSKPAPASPYGGKLTNPDDVENPFPMAPMQLKPWESGWAPPAAPELALLPSISTERDAVANVHAGEHAANEDFEPVPELADVRLAAGTEGIEALNEAASGVLHLRRSFLRRHGAEGGRARVVYASGDSMEPIIPSGAALLLVPAHGLTLRDVSAGGVWAINYGGKMLVKTITKPPSGMWVARSFNQAYPDILLETDVDVRIVGRIVWVGATLPPTAGGQWVRR